MTDIYRTRPDFVRARHFSAYTEALAPAAWNNWEGGSIYRFFYDNGQIFHVMQLDDGPVFITFFNGERSYRADIGDWIVYDGKTYRRMNSTDFHERYRLDEA